MLMLAFDTATYLCTVAVGREGKIYAEENFFAPQGHMEKLLPLIDATLRKASLTLADVEAIAVGLGPGSFTGVRIGVSTARALAQALDKPVIGISSLDVLAYALPASNLVSPVIDAKRKEVYFALYERDRDKFKRLTDYLVASPRSFLSQIKPYGPGILLAGDALRVYGKFLQKNLDSSCRFAPDFFWFPKASVLLNLALQRFGEAEKDPSKILPIYIRRPIAEGR